jgi:hypothetical protein
MAIVTSPLACERAPIVQQSSNIATPVLRGFTDVLVTGNTDHDFPAMTPRPSRLDDSAIWALIRRSG